MFFNFRLQKYNKHFEYKTKKMFIFHKRVLFMDYKRIFSKIYRICCQKGGDLANGHIDVIMLFGFNCFVVSNKNPSSSNC